MPVAKIKYGHTKSRLANLAIKQAKISFFQ